MPEEEKSIEQEIADILREVIVSELAKLNIPSDLTVKLEKPLDTSSLEQALKSGFKQLLDKKAPVLPQTDLTRLESLVEALIDRFDGFSIPDNSNVADAIVQAIKENKPKDVIFTPIQESIELLAERIEEANSKPVKVYGGSGGIASHIYDSQAGVIDPKTDGQISTVNSSTTALNDTEVFTGTWEDVSKYDSVVVSVSTDQDGTYSVQFSPDGTNQDSTLTRYYRTAQINVPHRFTVTRQYMRVVFTNNSGSNQTYFRLQTMMGDKSDLNVPVDSTMAQDYDAISTRPTDFRYEVALGRRQGYGTWNKFGYNEDVDTATDPEVVAAWGGAFTILTTASTLTIVSSSTDDDGDPAGTGAQTIRIIGIDANRNEQIEDFTMDGTSNVVSTSTWLGINRAVVLTSGTNDANVGTITITATTGGSTQATIPAGGSVTQQLIFFNYASHVALADWMQLNAKRFGSGTEPVVTFKGWTYSPLTDTKYEVFREPLDTSVQTEVILKPSQPFVFTEQDVFWIEAETTRDDTSVGGRFSLITTRDADA